MQDRISSTRTDYPAMSPRPTLLVTTSPRPESWADAITRRILERAKALGMTRAELGREMQMGQARLRRRLRNGGRITIPELVRFGAVLDVPLSALWGDEEEASFRGRGATP